MIISAPKPHPAAAAAKRVAKRVLSTLFRSERDGPPPTGVQLCQFGDVRLQLDFGTPAHVGMYWSGEFEPELTGLIARLARPGDVFVDIGANVGWHTLSLLTARPDVRRSYLFEPSKRTFEMLRAGIEATAVGDRCEARNMALGASSGTATFKTFIEFGSTHASLYALADWPYVEEQVGLGTLDSIAPTFVAPPAIIKCDVEGGERDVLQGASRLLAGEFGPPPLWLLEANYESAGMAGYFPYDLIDLAAAETPYQPFCIRDGRVVPLRHRTALRHGDTLILAVPAEHALRFEAADGLAGTRDPAEAR